MKRLLLRHCECVLLVDITDFQYYQEIKVWFVCFFSERFDLKVFFCVSFCAIFSACLFCVFALIFSAQISRFGSASSSSSECSDF